MSARRRRAFDSLANRPGRSLDPCMRWPVGDLGSLAATATGPSGQARPNPVGAADGADDRKEIDVHWLSPGDNAWQMTAATLVGLMSVPGLVVLYGGVMQKRSSVNSMMMAFIAFALV